VIHPVLVICLLVLAACSTPTPAAPPSAGGPPRPLGAHGSWKLTFSDEFTGTALDRERWDDQSSAEPDDGRGNLGNQQLEWNQEANCRVGDGELTMTARRERVTPSSGQVYEWTSCLITTTPADTFQYGFIEERAILPSVRGFWPAFWTWQAQGVDRHTETDVYEYYSDNPHKLYGHQFSGASGNCEWRPPFHPGKDWHTYGAAIEASGTTWFVDGTRICHTPATSDARTAIISNLAVYSKIPPDTGTATATKRVDYIRAWTAQ
jgi:beta-glucanase (GH16 family)